MSGYGAATTYQTQALMTASPAQLVVMLLEKATACLHEAITAIEAQQIEERWRANKRAIEIIHHLDLTLDLDRGGEIAVNLRQLYTFALRRLADVDFNNDTQAARDVITLLEPILASWRELARGQLEAEAPAVSSPAKAPAAAEAAPSVSLNVSA